MSTGTRTEEENGAPEPFTEMFERFGAREIRAPFASQFKGCRMCGDVRLVSNGGLAGQAVYCDHRGEWHSSAEAGDGRMLVIPVMVLERPVEGGRSGG